MRKTLKEVIEELREIEETYGDGEVRIAIYPMDWQRVGIGAVAYDEEDNITYIGQARVGWESRSENPYVPDVVQEMLGR